MKRLWMVVIWSAHRNPPVVGMVRSVLKPTDEQVFASLGESLYDPDDRIYIFETNPLVPIELDTLGAAGLARSHPLSGSVPRPL